MEPMTKRKRVQAALSGEPVDRIPISFWRHFPDLDLLGPENDDGLHCRGHVEHQQPPG